MRLRKRLRLRRLRGAASEREEIRSILHEEFLKSQLRSEIESQMPTASKSRKLLISVLSALVIAGIAGSVGFFSDLWLEDSRARDKARVEAQEQFFKLHLASESAVAHADFLRYAIVNDYDSQIVEERKLNWDRAYIAWKSTWRIHTASLDTFWGWSRDSPITDAIEIGYGQTLQLHDNCLTKAWNAYRYNTAAMNIVKEGLSNYLLEYPLSKVKYPIQRRKPKAVLRDCLKESLIDSRLKPKENPSGNIVSWSRFRLKDCMATTFSTIRMYIDRDLHCRSKSWLGSDRSPKANGHDSPSIVLTGNKIIKDCWGSNALPNKITLKISPIDYEKACRIKPTFLNKATGLVHWDTPVP